MKGWRDHFGKYGDEISVPYLKGALHFLPASAKKYTGLLDKFAKAPGKAAGFATGLLIEYVNYKTVDYRKNAKEISMHISKGGIFTAYRTIQEAEQGHYIVLTSCVYDIKIGNENHSYIIFESIYPVKVE